MMHVDDVTLMLRNNFPDSQVIVESQDQRHYAATVISDFFQGKKPVERQKMVYAIVGEHITSGAIHALSLKTFTLQEWQDK